MSISPLPLEVERVEGTEALESAREAWDALLRVNETRTADLTPDWQLTYRDHLAPDSPLYLLSVRENGEIVAVAPLQLRRSRALGIPIRYLEFLAAKESNYQDFIIGRRHEEVLAKILEFLVLHRREWDVLYFRHVPEDSTTARFLLDSPNRGIGRLVSRIAGTDPCIFLPIDRTWEQYRAESGKTRGKIAFKQRKLQKLGAVRSYHCDTLPDLETNLPRFFELHRKRWDGTDTPSQFLDDRYCRFYLEAGRKLFPRKQIDLFLVDVDAVPVAGLLTLRYDRGCIQQLTAYDPAYSHASPSLVMHEIYVQELFRDGMRVFDFGRYYPYKEAWAGSRKNRIDIKVHLGGLLSYCDHAGSFLFEAARGFVRRNKSLGKAVQYIRRRLRTRMRDRPPAS